MSGAALVDAYLAGERLGALLFLLAGTATLVLALVLLRRRGALRGMVLPLLAGALLQLGVGGTAWLRGEAQATALRQQHQATPAAVWQRTEATRLRTLLAEQRQQQHVGLGLLALGMALVVLLHRRRFWFAFGLGLVLQAGLTLALHRLVQARTLDHLQAVLNG